MTDGSRSRAVLAIMAKAPKAGHVKTRLARTYSDAAVVELYRALVEDTIDLARSLQRLDLVAVCPRLDVSILEGWLPRDVRTIAQRGSGLADGLRSAFDALCTPDRRRVVAFNADSPHLDPAVLVSAFDALDRYDLAVGPCDDGGYYLVGATASYPALFERPALGTASARDALIAQARLLRLSTCLTEEHYDIDLPEDVDRVARELADRPARAPRTAGLLAKWKPDGLGG
jgi:uncharacterized protein